MYIHGHNAVNEVVLRISTQDAERHESGHIRKVFECLPISTECSKLKWSSFTSFEKKRRWANGEVVRAGDNGNRRIST